MSQAGNGSFRSTEAVTLTSEVVDLATRVTRLEVHFAYTGRDLAEIRADQKELLNRTVKLATTGNLWTMIGTVAAIALAVIGIFIGVLTYLQDANLSRAEQAKPVVITAPSAPVHQPPAPP
jgi:hypothetical protein